jgi:hypothetical protein
MNAGKDWNYLWYRPPLKGRKGPYRAFVPEFGITIEGVIPNARVFTSGRRDLASMAFSLHQDTAPRGSTRRDSFKLVAISMVP